jgi:hypothetical protein
VNRSNLMFFYRGILGHIITPGTGDFNSERCVLDPADFTLIDQWHGDRRFNQSMLGLSVL